MELFEVLWDRSTSSDMVAPTLHPATHLLKQIKQGGQASDPFNQNFRKFGSETQWIGSVQPEKFRKNWSTF